MVAPEQVYFELEGRLFELDRLDEELGVASVVAPVVGVGVHLVGVESFMVLLSLLLLIPVATTATPPPSSTTTSTTLIVVLPWRRTTAINRCITLIALILLRSCSSTFCRRRRGVLVARSGRSGGTAVGRAIDLLIVVYRRSVPSLLHRSRKSPLITAALRPIRSSVSCLLITF